MGPQQRDVAGRGDVDEDHDDRRQRADDGGGGLGFHRHRLDLLGHLLAVAQHLGEVAERFRQVAAGFLLDRHHDAEEVRFRHRHALIEPRAGFAERNADRLGLDDRQELALAAAPARRRRPP